MRHQSKFKSLILSIGAQRSIFRLCSLYTLFWKPKTCLHSAYLLLKNERIFFLLYDRNMRNCLGTSFHATNPRWGYLKCSRPGQSRSAKRCLPVSTGDTYGISDPISKLNYPSLQGLQPVPYYYYLFFSSLFLYIIKPIRGWMGPLEALQCTIRVGRRPFTPRQTQG